MRRRRGWLAVGIVIVWALGVADSLSVVRLDVLAMQPQASFETIIEPFLKFSDRRGIESTGKSDDQIPASILALSSRQSFSFQEGSILGEWKFIARRPSWLHQRDWWSSASMPKVA